MATVTSPFLFVAEPEPVINQPHPRRLDPPQRRPRQRTRQHQIPRRHEREPRRVQRPPLPALHALQLPARPLELHPLNLVPLLPVRLHRPSNRATRKHRHPMPRRRVAHDVETQLLVHRVKQRRRLRRALAVASRQRQHPVPAQENRQSFSKTFAHPLQTTHRAPATQANPATSLFRFCSGVRAVGRAGSACRGTRATSAAR